MVATFMMALCTSQILTGFDLIDELLVLNGPADLGQGIEIGIVPFEDMRLVFDLLVGNQLSKERRVDDILASLLGNALDEGYDVRADDQSLVLILVEIELGDAASGHRGCCQAHGPFLALGRSRCRWNFRITHELEGFFGSSVGHLSSP
jgi:hypothetical protein